MPSVIIIGAGLAGIKTALDLYNGGIKDIIILEATDRVGGRLKSIAATQGNVTFDLGASWFHDGLNNPLFDKARKKGNIDFHFDDGKHVYFSKSHKTIATHKFTPVMEELMTFCNLYFEKHPEAHDVSLKELASEYVRQFGPVLTEDQKKFGPSSARMWAELWHGVPWDKVSAKYIFADGHLGRNVLVKNGYINVFYNEYHELPHSFRRENVWLNCKVSQIEQKDHEILVTTPRGTLSCSHLVVTVPQTCLRVKDPADPAYINWIPSLPPKIQRVLPEIYYGSLGKVIFEFGECFWPEDVDRFYGLSDAEISSDSDHIGPWDYPSLFVNYQHISNTPALVVLTQYPLSAKIESLSEEEIWDLFRPKLEMIAVKKVQKPVRVRRTEWNKDPLLRGSYSSVKVGSIDPSEIIQPFAEGFGRIGFAGAETMDDSSNGCAHGAWFSGEREAKKILKRVGNKL